MLRLVLAGLLTAVVVPLAALTLIAVTMAPGAGAACPANPQAVAIGRVPDSLETRTADGSAVRLDRVQLTHAATIIAVGARIGGVGREGIVVALMAGLTESHLLMYANTDAYPASARFPHDADGSDHDSLGVFQMRPRAGWGTVAQLMDPAYQARAFFGGPTGPDDGSPPGLLDIPGWRALPKGAAAQAVEVSAFPDRYARYEPVAVAILRALAPPPSASFSQADAVVALPPATGAAFPLPPSTWTRTSGYGMRLNPVLGVRRLHAGVDLAAPAGTPVLATAPGRVTVVASTGGLGNHIAISHLVDGAVMASVYGHLRDGGVHVAVGDTVTAGQQIGDVGSTGNSTGPHLHFELRPGGPNRPAIDPSKWLADANQDASAGTTSNTAPTSCLEMSS